MTSTEAMIHQLKNLKGKPLKQKLDHIFTYFWIPILAVAAILVLSVSYIVHVVTMKDPAFTVTCINAYAQRDQVEDYMSVFALQAGIDLDKYEVLLATDMAIAEDDPLASYETIQALSAQIAAQTIDIVVSEPQTIFWCTYQDAFADLTLVLSPEQQAKYEKYYLYLDMAVLKEIEAHPEEAIEYPDPTKPELMEEPVPVALVLPENGQFRQLCYPHKTGVVAVSILHYSQNLNHVLTFVDYIMQ